MQYRREIDGLRALALLPVIFFHADFEAFSGGFVGVDIFFVISGYLITSIILSEKQKGTFSLVNFYERRARRILPALFFIMLLCVIFAWFYLLPAEMKAFGQGIASSAAFMANIYFYVQDNNYFGLQSNENPILHLWSLAVEEQYYLIFPLLLILSWRYGARRIFYSLMFLAAVSFACAEWLSIRNPSANFFLLPTRGWEFLMGSSITFVSKKQNDYLNSRQIINQLLSATGLLLILFSICYFNHNTPFPSFWALFPTIGTALIIIFTTEKTVSYHVLANKFFVGIGLISYSAYLWHQPLFAFYRISTYQEPSKLSLFCLSLCSLSLAYVSWRFIEKPFRNKTRFSRLTLFSLSAVGMIGFLLFGIIGYFNNGYPNRNLLFSRLVSNVGLSRQCNGNYSINAVCATSMSPEVAIFGNSYAMHLVEGFKDTFPNTHFVQMTQDTCEPYNDNGNDRSGLGHKIVNQRNPSHDREGVEQLGGPYARNCPTPSRSWLGFRWRNDGRGHQFNRGKLSCPQFYKQAMSTLLNTPSIKMIIISSTFGGLGKNKDYIGLEDTIKLLKSAHKKIIIIGPTPSNKTNFGRCFLAHKNSRDLSLCNFKRSTINLQHFDITRRLHALALKYTIKFIDLTDIICKQNACTSSMDDILIYRDEGHLSKEGSRYIFKRLNLEI